MVMHNQVPQHNVNWRSVRNGFTDFLYGAVLSVGAVAAVDAISARDVIVNASTGATNIPAVAYGAIPVALGALTGLGGYVIRRTRRVADHGAINAYQNGLRVAEAYDLLHNVGIGGMYKGELMLQRDALTGLTMDPARNTIALKMAYIDNQVRPVLNAINTSATGLAVAMEEVRGQNLVPRYGGARGERTIGALRQYGVLSSAVNELVNVRTSVEAHVANLAVDAAALAAVGGLTPAETNARNATITRLTNDFNRREVGLFNEQLPSLRNAVVGITGEQTYVAWLVARNAVATMNPRTIAQLNP